MGESVNISLILRDIQLMRRKLDEIEEELLKLKIEELRDEELEELENLSRETLEKGIPGKRQRKSSASERYFSSHSHGFFPQ
ncbi:hypothetical protein [Thermococcus sp. JdF3]|uniref:hypothetical protein n=1 Tax=Thermococcus sp. JdF3 TaxID=1638258 RepID=UPI001F0D89CD|nr:hypothetical protein [Thermococcus sp. JdF3]